MDQVIDNIGLKGSSRKQRSVRAGLGVLAATLVMLASPALADISPGYKFLEGVRKRDGDAVEKALESGGSTIINTWEEGTRRTALHMLAEKRDLEWIPYFVSRGANVNAVDAQGRTPLSIATSLGWQEGVDFFLGRKALVNTPNYAGETPLIIATHRRDTKVMRLLLEAGADADRADSSGRSARDYARLDDKSGQALSTIETYGKKKGAPGGKPVYGPSF